MGPRTSSRRAAVLESSPAPFRRRQRQPTNGSHSTRFRFLCFLFYSCFCARRQQEKRRRSFTFEFLVRKLKPSRRQTLAVPAWRFDPLRRHAAFWNEARASKLFSSTAFSGFLGAFFFSSRMFYSGVIFPRSHFSPICLLKNPCLHMYERMCLHV